MKKTDLLSRALRSIAARTCFWSQTCTNLYIYRELEKVSLSQAKHIYTHMTNRELNTLYDLATGCGIHANVLEIGSYLGASSCYLVTPLARQDSHLFCVDTWENQTMPEGERDTFSEFSKNTSSLSEYITPVRKRSDDLNESDIIYPLNLVFIDGDHSYMAVKSDYDKVASWIIEGGILAFHDCTYYESVSRVVGEILASGSWQLAGHVDNLVWLRKAGKEYFTFANPMNASNLDEVLEKDNGIYKYT